MVDEYFRMCVWTGVYYTLILQLWQCCIHLHDRENMAVNKIDI